ncbi:MAG: Stage sporulation family protein [Nocardioidaceae bacterium]|nr:Stage sporulation family protein [Nocardioidaceae bacterium]
MSESLLVAPLRFVSGRANKIRRQMVYTDTTMLLMLMAVVVLITAGGVVWTDIVPYSALLIPMYLGSLWLGPRTLPWFIVFAVVGVSLMITVQPPTVARSVLRVVVTFLLALLILLASFRRSRLGIAGPKGESMLVDLRDRIIRQGEIAALPEAWYARSVLRSAGGTAFAGDFIVSNTTNDGGALQVVLVDVSGKGVEAGTRSLLLSGAFGGLLSALPAADFLPAANDFLVRQDWDEGFATAIQLHLHLDSGDFEIRKAGHPPAVWMRAGSGRWEILDSEGPVLGLLPDAEFDCVRGTLAPGDGLMLYTDGLVEDPRRDIASGIDKLAGRGQRLLQTGFEGGEVTLIDELERVDDDRALLLVHRRTA